MNQLEEGQIKVSHTFDAPLEMLWKAWTEPEHFMRWYGPKGFTAPTCEIDLREGGRHLWSMQSPDGRKMYFTGNYKEVQPMTRLVYTDSMSDANGNVMSAEMMGMPEGAPVTMDVIVTFEHADGKTTITVSHVGQGDAGTGWKQAFDKLEDMLAQA
ncbi:MAG: SRPBCC domain-containing protein [Anaerolineales bacterium]|nr:SRPBCC domain-containing protein [Anaerolineales bacterium]MDP2776122.1 SRPBCC domain-containing protein [Anaerolineales bacterium]